METFLILFFTVAAFWVPELARVCICRARYYHRSHFGYTSKIRGCIISKKTEV